MNHYPSPESLTGSAATEGADYGPNNHFVLLYESRDEQFRTVIPYLRRGLDGGERCLYFLDENTEAEVSTRMRAAGIDVDAAREAGLLSFHSSAEVYLNDGTFDSQAMIDELDETVTEAVEVEGYDHVRVTGEMTWALNGDEHLDALVTYESTVNQFYPGKDVTGLCQYNRERFSDSVLQNIVQSHPQLVYEETLTQNLFYVPPAHLDDETNTLDADRAVETLLRQARTRHQLAEREQGIAALTSTTQDLLTANPAEISHRTVENAREVLGTPYVAVCLYRAEPDSLRPCTTPTEADVFDPHAFHDRLWETFVTNEPNTELDLDACTDSALESGLVFPLGRHGVFVAAATDPDAFDAHDREFAATVSANAQAALDRADRVAAIQERENRLQQQNEALSRLNRINELVRETMQTIVAASSRTEIEEVVCDRLASHGRYGYVWIGDVEASTDRLTPKATAGVSRDYLDAVTPQQATTSRTEPSGVAAATRSVQVVDDVLGDAPFATWQREAYRREFRSVAAVPLVYDDAFYGVLTVYANEPSAFGDLERSVLAELGETVAFAITAAHRKQALVSEQVTELECRIGDQSLSVLEFVSQTGGEIEFQGLVSAADGSPRVFLSVRDVAAEAVFEYASSSVTLEDVELVAERDDELVFQCVVAESGLIPTLLAHAAVPRQLTVTDDGIDLTITLPTAVDVATFVGMLEEKYRDVELRARRERNRQSVTPFGFRAELEETLSPRQLEALESAFYGGYFAWPRESTGGEIAQRMDVSQPTFNRHYREGLRRLFTQLFEDGSLSDE